MEEKDQINPQHYRKHPSGVECIHITRHLDFDLGNAVKYVWRSGLKEVDKTVEDLEKALWYTRDEHTLRKAYPQELHLDVYLAESVREDMAKVLEHETGEKCETLRLLFDAALTAKEVTSLFLAECVIQTMIDKAGQDATTN